MAKSKTGVVGVANELRRRKKIREAKEQTATLQPSKGEKQVVVRSASRPFKSKQSGFRITPRTPKLRK